MRWVELWIWAKCTYIAGNFPYSSSLFRYHNTHDFPPFLLCPLISQLRPRSASLSLFVLVPLQLLRHIIRIGIFIAKAGSSSIISPIFDNIARYSQSFKSTWLLFEYIIFTNSAIPTTCRNQPTPQPALLARRRSSAKATNMSPGSIKRKPRPLSMRSGSIWTPKWKNRNVRYWLNQCLPPYWRWSQWRKS